MEIAFLFFLFFLSYSVSAIKINEVELNPEGTDTGKEWIELFSEQESNISDLIVRNYDNIAINLSSLLNVSIFSGYLVINFPKQFLDNTDEKVFLMKGDMIIHETPLFSDSANDNRTWQFCNSKWLFSDSTLGKENSCQNQTQPSQNQETTSKETSKIYLELDYDEEAEKEFESEVKAYNLENYDYDLKIYLSSDGRIISEIYDKEKEEWKSGNYYLNRFFSGSGNRTRKVSLRLNREYENFTGKAKINTRLREFEKSAIAEFEGDIKILNIKKQVEEKEEKEEELEEENLIIIKLNNPKDIKSEKEYKSKTEYIKEHSLIGFLLFCIFALIVLVKFRRWKKK